MLLALFHYNVVVQNSIGNTKLSCTCVKISGVVINSVVENNLKIISKEPLQPDEVKILTRL